MRDLRNYLPAVMILLLSGGVVADLRAGPTEPPNTYALIERARQLEKTSDTSAALAIYKELVQRDPSQRYRYAQFLARQGRIEEAIEQFKTHYADHPGNDYCLQQISELLAESGRIREAIDYAEQYLVSARRLPVGYVRDLRRLWERIGDDAEAYRHYRAMANDGAAPLARVVLARLVLADIESGRGDVPAAREQYWAALNRVLPPVSEWRKSIYHHVLAYIFVRREWFDDALAVYKRQPDYAVLLDLGRGLKQEGRGFEMLDVYYEYLSAAPQERIDRMPDGSAYTHREITKQILDQIVYVGESQALTERLRAAVAEYPQNPEPLRHLVQLFFRMERYDEGLREFERYLALKEKPLAIDYGWIGGFCKEAGLKEEAVRYYERALQMEWTDEDQRSYRISQGPVQQRGRGLNFRTQTLWKLADLYGQQERWAEAETCLKEILGSDGGSLKAQAKARLAELWNRTGQENVFLEDLERRVADDPCNVSARTSYAELVQRTGQTRVAVEQYEQTLRLSPEDLSLRLRLARALTADGQHDRALAEYKSVLGVVSRKRADEFRRGKAGDETEPVNVFFEMVRLCERLRDTERLLGLYEGVLESLKSPHVLWQPGRHVYERILRDMSEIYYRQGEYDRAAKLWLTYRKKVGYSARHAVVDRLEYLGPLRPYIETLQKETGGDPNDFWGRFILADVLAAERRANEAMDVYIKLVRDAPPDRDLHRGLGSLFADMKRDDLVLIAWKKELSTLAKGTWEYARKLGQIAALHLKSGDKEEAARMYREAIRGAPSEPEFRYGLFAATEGREGNARPKTESLESLKAKRARAWASFNQGNHLKAAELYEQILKKAPTDTVSMVHLARAYEKSGRKEEALSWYEKAYNMRKWGDSSVTHDLERFCRETGDEDKLITLFNEQHNYGAIRDFYKACGRPEKFEQYAIEQMKRCPDTWLHVYLGIHYLDGGNMDAAARVYEALRAKLVDGQGKVTDTTHIIALVRGFERLNRLDEALAIAASTDYENDPDANDRLGQLLTRLYVRTGQFEKALAICVLRLQKQPHESRTIDIAKQIVDLLQDAADAPKLIDGFLEDLKGRIPEDRFERFRGAVISCMKAHVQPSGEIGLSSDVLTLLKEGRKVTVPQECRSFADFLSQLASQADTAATQSFMFMSGKRMDAPRIDMTAGSAFEVLAAALNGGNVSMAIDQDGHWAFYEGADEGRTVSYAASGGLLCTTEGFNRRADRRSVWLLGRVYFEPAVQAHVASIQSVFQVIEAVDDLGRTVPTLSVESRWSDSGQIEVHLLKQEPPAARIMKMRVRTAVVCSPTRRQEDRAGPSPRSQAIPFAPAAVLSPADFPAGVEIVPFELTFHDLPIVERPPENR